MRLFIFGAGGHGREIAQLAKKIGHEVIAFVDDKTYPSDYRLDGISVLPATALTQEPVIIAIGNSSIRKTVVKRLGNVIQYATLIHPNVDIDEYGTINLGCTICSHCSIRVNVTIGNHVLLNVNSTIGHDCILEDYVSIMPGVNVSGCVRICEGAYIGTGAVIRNGYPDHFITIGAGAVVGMGAVVTKDVAAGTTVIGNPAHVKM